VRKRLLDRQAELIAYLTSGAAIFDDDCGPERTPEGFDQGLLRLEAALSHEKRMEKIQAIFPRTFEILGPEVQPLLREFTEACPPESIGRLQNALQFYEFLIARWSREPPQPAYLRDVAACELACAEVAASDFESQQVKRPRHGSRKSIRRAPHVVLLRCAHAVRPIFEQGLGRAIPEAHDTSLAIAMPPAADRPQIFEMLPAVFELMRALDDFVDLAAVFGVTPEVEHLIDELANLGLVEVSR
jgi:hypothetical protein